jgi:hypothetical protein
VQQKRPESAVNTRAFNLDNAVGHLPGGALSPPGGCSGAL